MNQVLPIRMTVDEFLRWSERQEGGQYELEDGRIIAMPAETFGHVEIKDHVNLALKNAIVKAGVSCYAVPDGMNVRIDEGRSYRPDAIVGRLPKPVAQALEVDNPLIVVEVLSPTSIRRGLTTKVAGYARVPSIEHYVVVDPEQREVLHFRRHGDVLVPPIEPLTSGSLRLDPPGLEVFLTEMIGPEPVAD